MIHNQIWISQVTFLYTNKYWAKKKVRDIPTHENLKENKISRTKSKPKSEKHQPWKLLSIWRKILRMKLENEEALHAQEIIGFILSKL